MARVLETDPINQLEENLQCTVCLEVLTDPRTLPCCHSFCKDCLEGVVQTCRDKALRGRPIREFPCPYCRSTFILDPDKHVADMPRNHFICNMVKATAVLDRGIGVPCSHNCSQSYSVARCVTCEKFLCRECLTVHNSYLGHNGHSVLTMEELSKPENRKKINDKMYCKEHSGMILKVYCETCNQLICRDCMDFKHVKQGHSCVLVKDVANNYKELLATNSKAMEDALTEGNVFLQRLLLATKQLDRDTENIKSKIAQRKEFVAKKVLEMLDQKAEILLKKVDKIHKGNRANFDTKAEKTKLYVENIKTSAQLSQKLVNQGTEEEIVSSQKMMLDNANHLLTKRQEYFKAPIPVAKLSYTVCTSTEALNEEILRGLANSLGEVNEDRVTEAVVERQGHAIKGRAVNVKLCDAEDKKRRTVLVSGFPTGATKESIVIHFQRKKNGGGEVEDVEISETGKALVVFEDLGVAEAIINKKQTFKGGEVLTLRSMATELDLIKAIKQGDVDIVGKEERTILVSELPEGIPKITIHIHFQRKKNNGGEVEDTVLLPGGKQAWVIFEDPKVAEKVVDIEQIIRGKRVRVELLKTETQATERIVESATILVSGLPEGVTENRITIHFHKRKNGGGEVKKVQLSSDRKEATVTFDDPKVAEKVVDTEQIIQGERVRVELLKTETQATERIVESATILVSGLPEGVTENRITMHFQKRRNGGGDVKKVQLLSDRKEATVTFDDPKVAKTAVSIRQEILRTLVTVILLDNDEKELVKETPPDVVANPGVTRTSEVGTPPELTAPEAMKTPTSEVKPPGVTTATKVNLSEETMPHKVSPSSLLLNQEVDEVYSVVTGSVNPALMNTISHPASENFWSNVFDAIVKSCGVHCQPSAYGVTLAGRLSQVVSAGEILKVKWRSHCQDLQLRNVDYYNVFNQAATTFSQHGTTMNQAGTAMDQAGTAIYQADTTFNQYGTTFKPRFQTLFKPR